MLRPAAMEPDTQPWCLLGKSGRNLFVAVEGRRVTGEDLVRYKCRDGNASQMVVYIGN
jgi:hypothetical protein